MNPVEMIRKKRDGHSLSEEEIRAFISGYTDGLIPDYQLSAWAMAVYFQGMNEQETATLTMAMVDSGETVDLTAIEGIKVDKHSTGGVGDTTTLVVAPLVAAEGVPVAKLSGRGLGHTGGTIDKLESIPGFSTELPIEEFIQLVNRSNLALMGQTADLTPADKQLYSLRDVTATVDSIPLIASSIMSKKIAAGADAILLDVKTGAGAFMKEEAEAIRLAQTMVQIGANVGRKTVAVISDMNQPLGRAVGNALEVKEAIETLQGKGSEDLTELSLTIASQMLVLAGESPSIEEARNRLEKSIREGKAIEKFREFLVNQNGDPAVVDFPDRVLGLADPILFRADEEGFIHSIAAEEVGLCAMRLGAGRERKLDEIDHRVGIWLHKKVGDPVHKNDPIASLYIQSTERLTEVMEQLRNAITIGAQPVTPLPLLRAQVTESGVIVP